jgi:hippurate hydrolase
VKSFGAANVTELERPFMGSEDFAYMLVERPGTYFFLGGGKGENDFQLHHPSYDFNDDLIPIGAAFWTELAEAYLKPE